MGTREKSLWFLFRSLSPLLVCLFLFVCFVFKKIFLAYLHNFMNHYLISDASSLARSRFPRPFLLILKVSPHCRRTGWLAEKLEEPVAAAPFLSMAARWHPCST